LQPALKLLGDLLIKPTFSNKDIDRLIRETRADIIDSRADDRTLCGRHFRRHLFAGHWYGRPPQGTLDTLSAISREDIINAVNTNLVRSNVIVGASGDVTQAEIEPFVREYIHALPNHPRPEVGIIDPQFPAGKHLVIVDKPERTQTQIYMGGAGASPHDKDYAALTVGNTIFGGTFTARLMREIRSKRGWSYGAHSRLGRGRAREAWTMWTFPAATDAAACIKLQLQLLSQWIERGVTESEVTFAKQYLLRSTAFEIDTASKRLSRTLEEILLGLGSQFFQRHIRSIEAITKDDVNTAIRKRISPNNLLVAVVATASSISKQLEDSIENLATTHVIPFDADVLPQPNWAHIS